MSDSPTLVQEGEALVSRWHEARLAQQRARDALNRAECELSNATTALGKWITPADTKPGESLSVWWGKTLITAIRSPNGHGPDYTITQRTR